MDPQQQNDWPAADHCHCQPPCAHNPGTLSDLGHHHCLPNCTIFILANLPTLPPDIPTIITTQYCHSTTRSPIAVANLHSSSLSPSHQLNHCFDYSLLASNCLPHPHTRTPFTRILDSTLFHPPPDDPLSISIRTHMPTSNSLCLVLLAY